MLEVACDDAVAGNPMMRRNTKGPARVLSRRAQALSHRSRGGSRLVKNKRRVSRAQLPCPPPHQQIGSERFVVDSRLRANAHVIAWRITKHVPIKNWGLDQWAQYALLHLYPSGVPKHLNKSRLERDVNAWLAGNAEYCATNHKDEKGKPKRLSRLTVLRAAGL